MIILNQLIQRLFKKAPIGKEAFWAILSLQACIRVQQITRCMLPFRQNVGLFVPAVPALDVTTTTFDKSDQATGIAGVTVQSLGTTAKILRRELSGYCNLLRAGWSN